MHCFACCDYRTIAHARRRGRTGDAPPPPKPPCTNRRPAAAAKPWPARGDGGAPDAGAERSVHREVAGSKTRRSFRYPAGRVSGHLAGKGWPGKLAQRRSESAQIGSESSACPSLRHVQRTGKSPRRPSPARSIDPSPSPPPTRTHQCPHPVSTNSASESSPSAATGKACPTFRL